ncbi:SMP-30/gluconolactonase/LRE family protein [Leeia sp.]|uniref:SMP-30/gluconolactonase/LRE family protein n=1 Tax=Leeia sp. TaxID=2884678 RepID=UPI0035B1A4F3
MTSPRLSLLLAAVLTAATVTAAPAVTPLPQTDLARQWGLPDDFYPESITADSRGNVYVSSFRQGAVARLLPGQQQAQVFIPSGSNGLVSAQGLVVDEARNTLWVCSGDFGYSTAAPAASALKRFDLQTGAPMASYPLPGGGYCNDMALDSKGTLYITDSIQPRILRWRSHSAGLEVWAQGGALAAGRSGLTLNGIALDGDDTLYLSKVDAENYLVQIPVNADGTAGQARQVQFPRTLQRVDGLRRLAHGQLVFFENDVGGTQSAISLARITGETATVQPLADARTAPTPSSGTIVGKRVYYLNSKFSQLLAYTPQQLHQLPVGVSFSVQVMDLP